MRIPGGGCGRTGLSRRRLIVAGMCFAGALAGAVGAETIPPAAPSNLVASMLSCSRLDLSWSASFDSGGAGLAGYRVYRNGIFVAQVTSTAYTPSVLAASSTYTFAVSAVDHDGNESIGNPSVTVTTPACPDRVPPDVPTGLTVAASISCTRLDLAWNRSTDYGGAGLAGYRIYRNGVAVAFVSSTTFADQNLTPSTAYTYSVAAVDNSGNQSNSSPPSSTQTPPCSDTTAPAPPSGVTVVAPTCMQVIVSWTASPDGGLRAYNVYRNGLFFTQVLGTVTAIALTGLSPSATYAFAVGALDPTGNESVRSAPASIVMPACVDTTPPAVPSGVSAIAVDCTQIDVRWGAVTDAGGGSGLSGYRVRRDGVAVQFVPAPAVTWRDGGRAPATSYVYTVNAVDGSGNESAASAAVRGTTPSCSTNQAPVASAGADQLVQTLLAVQLSASASYDPDGVIASYAWTFGDGASGAGVAVSHIYTTSGTYTVTLTVTDDDGARAADSLTVRVANRPPTARAGSDQTTIVGQGVSFSAAGSSDPDGGIVNYRWTFGDGNTASGQSASHAYAAAGTYTVVLTVEDAQGATATDSATVTVADSQPMASAWARRLGGTAFDQANGVAVDAAGNVVVTGGASGRIDLGAGVVCNEGIFIAKYAPDGSLRWTRCVAGPTGGGSGRSVAVDDAGNVLVTGAYRGTVDFGGGPVANRSSEGYDVFVAKYAPAGALLWVRTFGSPIVNLFVTEAGNGVGADASGNIFVAGTFQDTVDFGGGALTSVGDQDVFLAKYGPAGNHLWSRRFGGSRTDVVNALAVDATGNVVIAGSYADVVDFGGGPLAGNGYDGFVATFTGTGAPLWSRHFGGTLQDTANAVALDGAGNVVVSGTFAGVADFGAGSLTSAGGVDVFLAKYSFQGAPLWARQFGGTSTFDAGNGVAVDPAGNVFLTGAYLGSVDFGGGPLPALGSRDVVLAKFSPTGMPLWSQGLGSTNIDAGYAVALTGNGAPVVAGAFFGSVDFGPAVLVSAGSADAFVLHIEP